MPCWSHLCSNVTQREAHYLGSYYASHGPPWHPAHILLCFISHSLYPSHGSPFPACQKDHATVRSSAPWSHITIDFLTDLPESQDNTTILIITDWFSKSLCLVPLPCLPTTFEMAELIFNHVLCYVGVTAVTVSNWGPDFTSRVWKSFTEKLGVSMSLKSGYHPQAND